MHSYYKHVSKISQTQMGFGASSTEGYIQWCNRTNIDIWGTGMGESLNKTKQLEEISASAKNDEYQNSQGIENTVI